MNQETFGRALRQLRRRNAGNVSLADLAEAMGCSITYLSAIERGERNPPSNAMVESALKHLGELGELSRMLDLATKARKSIDFPLAGASEKWTNVLVGLARRSEEGKLTDDDPILERIANILNTEQGPND